MSEKLVRLSDIIHAAADKIYEDLHDVVMQNRDDAMTRQIRFHRVLVESRQRLLRIVAILRWNEKRQDSMSLVLEKLKESRRTISQRETIAVVARAKLVSQLRDAKAPCFRIDQALSMLSQPSQPVLEAVEIAAQQSLCRKLLTSALKAKMVHHDPLPEFISSFEISSGVLVLRSANMFEIAVTLQAPNFESNWRLVAIKILVHPNTTRHHNVTPHQYELLHKLAQDCLVSPSAPPTATLAMTCKVMRRYCTELAFSLLLQQLQLEFPRCVLKAGGMELLISIGWTSPPVDEEALLKTGEAFLLQAEPGSLNIHLHHAGDSVAVGKLSTEERFAMGLQLNKLDVSRLIDHVQVKRGRLVVEGMHTNLLVAIADGKHWLSDDDVSMEDGGMITVQLLPGCFWCRMRMIASSGALHLTLGHANFPLEDLFVEPVWGSGGWRQFAISLRNNHAPKRLLRLAEHLRVRLALRLLQHGLEGAGAAVVWEEAFSPGMRAVAESAGIGQKARKPFLAVPLPASRSAVLFVLDSVPTLAWTVHRIDSASEALQTLGSFSPGSALVTVQAPPEPKRSRSEPAAAAVPLAALSDRAAALLELAHEQAVLEAFSAQVAGFEGGSLCRTKEKRRGGSRKRPRDKEEDERDWNLLLPEIELYHEVENFSATVGIRRLGSEIVIQFAWVDCALPSLTEFSYSRSTLAGCLFVSHSTQPKNSEWALRFVLPSTRHQPATDGPWFGSIRAAIDVISRLRMMSDIGVAVQRNSWGWDIVRADLSKVELSLSPETLLTLGLDGDQSWNSACPRFRLSCGCPLVAEERWEAALNRYMELWKGSHGRLLPSLLSVMAITLHLLVSVSAVGAALGPLDWAQHPRVPSVIVTIRHQGHNIMVVRCQSSVSGSFDCWFDVLQEMSFRIEKSASQSQQFKDLLSKRAGIMDRSATGVLRIIRTAASWPVDSGAVEALRELLELVTQQKRQ